MRAWRHDLQTPEDHPDAFRARAEAGITIADLTVLGPEDERELIVRYLNCARKPRIDPEQVLVDWARHTGYSAVWLPDGLVRIPPADQPIGGGASVICPSCGARWQDSRPGFWEQVRGHGYFPDRCSLCGGPLPEWLVLELGS